MGRKQCKLLKRLIEADQSWRDSQLVGRTDQDDARVVQISKDERREAKLLVAHRLADWKDEFSLFLRSLGDDCRPASESVSTC